MQRIAFDRIFHRYPLNISGKKQLLIGLFALALVLVIGEISEIDLRVQDFLYNADAAGLPPHARWVIDTENAFFIHWFHHYLKIPIFLVGISAAIIFFYSLWRRTQGIHWISGFLLLACVAVPSLVGGAKYLTNTYCPLQITRYGGEMPYVKLLERYPAGFVQTKNGHCFPAGHATSGFALMALYFCFRHRRAQHAGLAFGVGLGWVAGLFQMLRGEHFLSHTLVSMIASWLVILGIYALVRWMAQRFDYAALNAANAAASAAERNDTSSGA